MASTGHPSFPPSYLREYSGTRLSAVSIAFTVIMPVFVALRFLVRHWNKSPLGWDDCLIFPALVAIWGVDDIAICMPITLACLKDAPSSHANTDIVQHAGVSFHAAAVVMKKPETMVTWAKSFIALEWL